MALQESCFFVDDKISKDLLGVCTDYFCGRHLCFSLKKNLVYDVCKDRVIKAHTICQFSEKEPSNQMDSTFHYGLSLMNAFEMVATCDATVPIVRYVFVGDSLRMDNGADLCAIAEIEALRQGEQVCPYEYRKPCINHASMFPFCQCTAHIHGCRTEYSKMLNTPKVRVIMPLMEPLMSPSCHIDTSCDAELLRSAFLNYKQNSGKFHHVHVLDSVNLRLK